MQTETKIPGGQVLAVFDFDGTITNKDSFNDFIVWRFGYARFCLAMLCISPLVVLYLCRLVPNHLPKGNLFRLFFRASSVPDFLASCRRYSTSRLDRLIRPEARDRMRWHLQQGHTLVIVSASIGEWIEPWAQANGVAQVIATRIELENGKLSGAFLAKNCYGKEKVDRLLECYPHARDSVVYAYGDSLGDRELLAMATHSFYRKFS